jgi:hypothetical protein
MKCNAIYDLEMDAIFLEKELDNFSRLRIKVFSFYFVCKTKMSA